MTARRATPRGPDSRGLVLGGRYVPEELLGSGGSGDVYAATDRVLRRRVAVKVVHPDRTRSPSERDRIRQEAILGARIAHPNVAPVLDLGEDRDARGDDRLFIVMPLLEGRTLRELILDGPLPWRDAGVWLHQLLSGLSALHARGVLHRDIKPDNCFIAREGDRDVLKILDLGLAKATAGPVLSRGHAWHTTRGRLVGTLPYLSPEQALGEPVDERSDVYAAGVVLFELLTRRPPFVGSDYQVLVGHVEHPPPRPSALAGDPTIPPALDELTLAALAKRPDDRLPSAASFDAALVELLRRAGVELEPGPTFAGCREAQASLAAWTCFEYSRARAEADLAARRNRAWGPLRLLMSLVPEE